MKQSSYQVCWQIFSSRGSTGHHYKHTKELFLLKVSELIRFPFKSTWAASPRGTQHLLTDTMHSSELFHFQVNKKLWYLQHHCVVTSGIWWQLLWCVMSHNTTSAQDWQINKVWNTGGELFPGRWRKEAWNNLFLLFGDFFIFWVKIIQRYHLTLGLEASPFGGMVILRATVSPISLVNGPKP